MFCFKLMSRLSLLVKLLICLIPTAAAHFITRQTQVSWLQYSCAPSFWWECWWWVSVSHSFFPSLKEKPTWRNKWLLCCIRFALLRLPNISSRKRTKTGEACFPFDNVKYRLLFYETFKTITHTHSIFFSYFTLS